MLDAYRGAASLIETKPDEAKGKFLEAWSLWRPNGAALMQAGLIAEQQGNAPEAQRLLGLGGARHRAGRHAPVVQDARHVRDVPWLQPGRGTQQHVVVLRAFVAAAQAVDGGFERLFDQQHRPHQLVVDEVLECLWSVHGKGRVAAPAL